MCGGVDRIGPLEESQKRQLGLTYRSDWHPTSLQAAFLETFRYAWLALSASMRSAQATRRKGPPYSVPPKG